jgi:hypothetical protein
MSLPEDRSFKRPPTPGYLRAATFDMFGERCLRCDLDRPLQVAHILDWRTCVKQAGELSRDRLPPRDWHYREAVRYFHDLGNVLPLCGNCHLLYDDSRYGDITECELRRLRDAAVQEPETLAKLITFVRRELSGRPNRCAHDGRPHGRATDLLACMWPLTWISDGYARGVLTEDPNLVVPCNSGSLQLRLDLGQIEPASAAL